MESLARGRCGTGLLEEATTAENSMADYAKGAGLMDILDFPQEQVSEYSMSVCVCVIIVRFRNIQGSGAVLT